MRQFTITATAKGAQLADKDCKSLTIDELDQPKSYDADGDESSGCWN